MDVLSKTLLTNLDIPILWKTRDTMLHTLASKVSLLSHRTPRISRFGQGPIGTSDKTNSSCAEMGKKYFFELLITITEIMNYSN